MRASVLLSVDGGRELARTPSALMRPVHGRQRRRVRSWWDPENRWRVRGLHRRRGNGNQGTEATLAVIRNSAARSAFIDCAAMDFGCAGLVRAARSGSRRPVKGVHGLFVPGQRGFRAPGIRRGAALGPHLALDEGTRLRASLDDVVHPTSKGRHRDLGRHIPQARPLKWTTALIPP